MTSKDDHMKQYEEMANEHQKQKEYQKKEENYKFVIMQCEEKIKYLKSQRGVRHEQIQITDNYIHEFEKLSMDAQLKLLQHILYQ